MNGTGHPFLIGQWDVESRLARRLRPGRELRADGVRQTGVVSRFRRAVVVSIVVLSGCMSDQSTTPDSKAPLTSPSTTAVVSASVPEMVPAGFCDLAVRATEGSVSMDVDVDDNELARFPGLSDHHREMIRAVVIDAIPQVRSGSFDTTRLVAVVNEICGSSLTPVTMTQ